MERSYMVLVTVTSTFLPEPRQQQLERSVRCAVEHSTARDALGEALTPPWFDVSLRYGGPLRYELVVDDCAPALIDDLEEFLEANRDGLGPDEVEAIRGLFPGQSFRFGGGAAPTVDVVCQAPRIA